MRPKVLIVEDERLIARDLQQRLLQLGYEVLPISDRASEAIATAQADCPQVVLMDIRIKGDVDGIICAQQLRQYCDAPVVFLTAHADEATLQQSQSAQPFGYLIKPVETHSLRAAIEVALTRHQAERSLRLEHPVYRYQVGGSLGPLSPSYSVRQADHQLYSALSHGEFCYVFTARQMGKSSLRVRTKHQLEQAGMVCASIDLTTIGSRHITPKQWYQGVAATLARSLNVLDYAGFSQWWREHEYGSPLQSLSCFIEDVVLRQYQEQRLCIFIDEIDSILSLEFPLDDFFSLIRFFYNQRSENPAFQRLTFALFGVTHARELISDRTRSPFNIGTAIELRGLEGKEAYPLSQGLATVVPDADAVLQEILRWTQGQPFLTQKLCSYVTELPDKAPQFLQRLVLGDLRVGAWVDQLVRTHLIAHWETRDEPEHLKTIRARLLYPETRACQLLGLYQRVLQGEAIAFEDTPEQLDLLLSGVVLKREGQLVLHNPIYGEVFSLDWVERRLEQLRPYSQDFQAWLRSECRDAAMLLTGQSLRDAQRWASGKQLSPLDYEFLAVSEAQDRSRSQQQLERERTHALELRLMEQSQRLSQEAKNLRLQRWVLGLVGLSVVLGLGLGYALVAHLPRALPGAPLDPGAPSGPRDVDER